MKIEVESDIDSNGQSVGRLLINGKFVFKVRLAPLCQGDTKWVFDEYQFKDEDEFDAMAMTLVTILLKNVGV